MNARDVFICHASEDKSEVVRPLVEACTQAGITCWYDEAEIKWGDSITHMVNEGLSKSRYVIVVFSATFLAKNWPKRELNAVLNQEASTGEVKVLPLLIGSERDKQGILDQFPLLNDKRYLPWNGDLREIVTALTSRLGNARDGSEKGANLNVLSPGLRIPLPKIKKQFTQRDRDIFVREAFNTVREYFQNALEEVDRHYEEVETDFSEIHAFKFISTLYIRGEVAKRCKIWLGAFRCSDSIAYQTGEFSIDSDNALNDVLGVEDDGASLGFRPSGMWLGGQKFAEGDLLNAEAAAEYLWSRFTENVG